MELNEQQKQVVTDPVGNLLISAAAGSGKTSVMTERIASRVIAGLLDLRRVLVMTFTNAAAANMLAKVEGKLAAAFNEETKPEKRALIAAQMSALSSAHISTIHSFCLSVIDNFCYDAKTSDASPVIDPGYVTLDDTRAKLLLKQALDDVLASLYEEQYLVGKTTGEMGLAEVTGSRDQTKTGPFVLDGTMYDRRQWFLDFERMIASFGKRDDKEVREMILSIHSLLRSMPDYEVWLRESLEKLKQTAADFPNSQTALTLMADFRIALHLCEDDLIDLETILSDVSFVKDKNKNLAYQDLFAAIFSVLRRLLKAEHEDLLSYNLCREAMCSLPEGKLPSRKKDDPDDLRASFFEKFTSVKEVLSYLGYVKPDLKSSRTNARFLFAKTEEEIEAEFRHMLPVASRLLETVLLTDDRYATLKRAENAIDFSDYEHLALLILQRPDAKKYYSSQFDEIYIDEYQDNSRIQEAIVSCFSRDNCFAVGDVKQSIYRFRHARPQIFLGRMQEYLTSGGGLVRELNCNYRSDPRILSFINDVFEQILTRDSGEIDYDSSQRLVPGILPTDELGPSPTVEFLLLDVTKGAGEAPDADALGEDPSQRSEDKPEIFADEQSDNDPAGSLPSDADNEEIDPEKTEKEALLVALKIRELAERSGAVWSDFAVLCRKNKEVEIFTNVLHREGIPAEGKSADDFLSSRELLLMESLIRILDNFCQDIPLAAVMRALFPQAGFTDEELLHIKLALRSGQTGRDHFYDAVLDYRNQGTNPVLRDRVIRFCDWIDSLRSASMYLRVSELIERIYNETGIRESVSSLSDGTARVSTLEAFRDWAGRFDSGRNKGLYRFVTYVQDLRSRKESPDSFAEEQIAKDVVRCSTIHKSKGLEYRIVFLTGIGRSFVKKISSKKLSLSERFGIAVKYIDPDEGLYFDTHLSMAADDEEKSADLAEQMRMLYVAMTRAREKLYLTSFFERNKDGVFQAGADLIRYAAGQKDTSLPAWLVKKAKSYLDLCLLALARNPNIDLSQLVPKELCDGSAVNLSVSADRSSDIGLEVTTYDDIKRALIVPMIHEDTAAPQQDHIDEENETYDDDTLFAMQCDGVYRYDALTKSPAKISVSELKRRQMPIAKITEGDDEPFVYPEVTVRPINLLVHPGRTASRREELSPTERGTLLHSVFQYLDFSTLSKDPTNENVDAALSALVEKNMLPKEKLDHVIKYKESIRCFAASEICRRIVAAESRAQCGPFREIPFSLAVSRTAEDMCLVQGMIDCWFIEDGEAVLIDYKTDMIRGTDKEKREVLEERYHSQLAYYSRAITSASRLRVKEKIIWLIPDGLSFVFEDFEKKM